MKLYPHYLIRNTVVTVLTVFSVHAWTLGAASVLDQTQIQANNIYRIQGSVEIAQTFTPSVSGYFDHLMLWANSLTETNEFTIHLTETQNGVPGKVLGTTTQTSFIPSIREWYSYDFSQQAIELNAGSQYAVVLRSPGLNNGVAVGGYMGDLYSGGRVLERVGAGPWGITDYALTGNFGEELTFQTYMTPIPEPASSSVFMLGLLVLSGLKHWSGRGRSS